MSHLLITRLNNCKRASRAGPNNLTNHFTIPEPQKYVVPEFLVVKKNIARRISRFCYCEMFSREPSHPSLFKGQKDYLLELLDMVSDVLSLALVSMKLLSFI